MIFKIVSMIIYLVGCIGSFHLFSIQQRAEPNNNSSLFKIYYLINITLSVTNL